VLARPVLIRPPGEVCGEKLERFVGELERWVERPPGEKLERPGLCISDPSPRRALRCCVRSAWVPSGSRTKFTGFRHELAPICDANFTVLTLPPIPIRALGLIPPLIMLDTLLTAPKPLMRLPCPALGLEDKPPWPKLLCLRPVPKLLCLRPPPNPDCRGLEVGEPPIISTIPNSLFRGEPSSSSDGSSCRSRRLTEPKFFSTFRA